MKSLFQGTLSTSGLFLMFMLIAIGYLPKINEFHKHESVALKPSELHALSKIYPYFNEAEAAYQKARIEEFARIRKTRSSNNWTHEGALNIPGRVNSVAVDPNDTNKILIALPGGGIQKTVNGGSSWYPVFYNQIPIAVSDIVYEPGNSNVVYAGTGDQVLSGFSYVGNGVYKSIDGGETWNYIGLAETKVISKLYVDSINKNIIYASAMGSPFVKDVHRGMYKSVDGGATWSKILYLADSVGIGDFVVHPTNNAIVYATGRHRTRSNVKSIVNGAMTRIYKTVNGGATWDTLSNGINYANDTRIGLAISKSDPNILYAVMVDSLMEFAGIYRTSNAGGTWNFQGVSTTVNMGGFGWYFGKVFIAPNNNNKIFVSAVDLWESTNGGASFSMVGPAWYTYQFHADKHDMYFLSSNKYLVATDGGLYKTYDGGSTFTQIGQCNSAQYYGVAANPHQPEEYYTGAQDNGTAVGNAQFPNGWLRVFGGDGFKPAFDKNQSDFIMAETQRGNLHASVDGGNSFSNITNSIVSTDHTNWEMPYLLSWHNPQDVWAGSYRMHLSSTNDNDNFTPVSPDLTDFSTSTNPKGFHTISSIGQSPLNHNYIYAGTSDAHVWITTDYGTTWNKIDNGLPTHYVSSVAGGYANSNTMFVGMTGYRTADSTARIFRSVNLGSTWQNIAGNLPKFAINDILILPFKNDSAIIVANDGGVYATADAGSNWFRVGDNMPIVPVFDVEYDSIDKKVLAATFGVGLMSMPIDSVFNLKNADDNVSIPDAYNSNARILVYPNPCNNYIYLSSNQQSFNYRIVDVFGRLITSGQNNGLQPIYTAQLANGFYNLQIWTDDKRYHISQFTKQ